MALLLLSSRWALPRMALIVSALLVAAACSSDATKPAGSAGGTGNPAARSASGTPTAATPSANAQPFSPVVASSELVVGRNRFALGIIDEQTKLPLPDAQVRFRFFTLKGDQGTLRSEADALFVATARDAGAQPIVNHLHADGANHPHTNAQATIGVYVSQVTFDQAGKWGIQAVFRAADGREGAVQTAFDVVAQTASPMIGQPAPRSRNLTARDVTDLSQIDSAAEPVAALHQTTVADAIAAGRPGLVAFATPGYCETLFCGPVYDVVAKLLPKYGDKAALIHIEVYKDPVKQIPAEAFLEWKLVSEPVVFVFDRAGTITAKFEGPVGLAELDAALAQVTS